MRHLSPCLIRGGIVVAALGLLSPFAFADVLELTDGRLVEGAVEKKDDGYHVVSRFGEAVLPLDQVKTWTRATPLDEQIRQRLAALPEEDVEGRAAVAVWMKQIGREEEARALAEAILEIDPECARAHEVLGHLRHQGAWRTPDEAKRAEGLEKHGDRWYTPEEWKNLSGGDRAKAEAEAERLAREQRAAAVNEAVRLMTSPDKLVRQRGKRRLEALAEETGDKRLRDLIPHVEAYVEAGDRVAAAALQPDRAMVLGELRLTYAKLKRPIEVFETSLASGPVGGSAPVRIQLPELEVIHLNTTVGIPASK